MTYDHCSECKHTWHGLTCIAKVDVDGVWGGKMTETCGCSGQFKDKDADISE